MPVYKEDDRIKGTDVTSSFLKGVLRIYGLKNIKYYTNFSARKFTF